MPGKSTLAERLWSKVDRSGGPSACWPWQGKVNDEGYAYIHAGEGRGQIGVHRAAVEVTRGMMLPGLVLRHKCNNRRCCNPRHLIPGTHKENSADCVASGRQWWQRLTPEVRAYIISREGQMTAREVGAELGMNGSIILMVWSGHKRKHVS